MSIITGFCMFFLSFAPLWISVLFIDIKSICEGNTNIWTEIISVSLVLSVSVISLIVLMCELNPRNTSGQQEYRIISAKEEKTITAEFLLSYILPLFAKVSPADYRLFQVGDLVCTMELLAEKAESNTFSRSESEFFGSPRTFRKDLLKGLRKKML